MKKWIASIILLSASVSYADGLIGNYAMPTNRGRVVPVKKISTARIPRQTSMPQTKSMPQHSPQQTSPFLISAQNAFLLKPVSLSVQNAPIQQALSYLSGITQVPIELKDNIHDRVSFYGKGTLKSVLDTFCANNNLYYKVENGKIIVRRYISAVFQLNVPMTAAKKYSYNMTFGQNVTNNSSGGMLGGATTNPIQSTGTNSSSSTFNFNENLVQNITKLITPLLQDRHSKISYDPNTGLLTFYGSINDYETVKSVVNKLNRELSKPIKIRMDIIAINLLNEYSTGINISALFHHLKNLNLSLTTPIGLTNASNSLFQGGISGSNYNALISALQQYGKAKSIDSETYTVLPNQPVVYAPTNTQSYISSYNIYIPPTVAGVVSTPAYVPIVSYLNTGTDITILPRLANNKKLMVDVYYSQNTVQNINSQNITISQGVTVPIQFPEVASQNSVLTSVLKPGQTIALISSVYDLKKNNEAGIPFLVRLPVLKYLFGSTDKYSNKVQFIITITYEGLGGK